MRELRAVHPMTNMTIVERFIDGIRYMKVTPKNLLPMILEKLKMMFADKPVKFELSEDGWIRFEKTGQDEQMEKAVKKAGNVKEGVDEGYILQKEKEMLEKQGFDVKISSK